MNLDELRSVQSKERRKDSLQQLRDSFYQDVAAYIQDLRAERDRRAEQVDNPFSDNEIRRLSDELDTAEEVAEALYERRVGKVVKLASFAAADMSASENGMTAEEQELFDDLVARIKRNKASVLDVLAGEADTNASPAAAESAPPDTAAAATPTASTPQPESPPTTSDEPATIGDTDDQTTGSPPQPDNTEAERDGVLANAMGAGQSEAGTDDRTAVESLAGGTDQPGGTDAALDGTANNDDGVPTPDGGSAVQSSRSTDTTAVASPNEVDSKGSQSESPPESTTPPGADEVTGTTASTPDAESESTTSAVTEPAAAEPANSATTTDSPPRTMVRITDDVGTIFGVDEREYALQREDIVTLPTTNAEVLLQQDAATKVD